MKRGRPALQKRERYPSGQAKPESAGVTWTQLQRLRTLTRDGIFGTRIGEMLFLGEVSQLEADVAFNIAKIYGRHDRAIGVRRFPASPAYQTGSERSTAVTESDLEMERSQRAMEEFTHLSDHLKQTSAMTRIALIDLCVHDLALPPLMLPQVRKVLDSLAEPLGLRRRRRAG